MSFKSFKSFLAEDWQDSKYKNPEGGLTKAGVEAYKRENPGSNLKTAVRTPPSKLKPGSERLSVAYHSVVE